MSLLTLADQKVQTLSEMKEWNVKVPFIYSYMFDPGV